MRFAAILSVVGLAIAKSADCIVDEINALRETVRELDCSVERFHHSGNPCTRYKDIRPLLHINKLNIETDSQLHDLIDGIQSSCPFSTDDTQKILVSLSAVSEPITKTLNAFKTKHCEFEQAIGPVLSHRIIGGGLRQTRCLAMDLLRSLEVKADPNYKEIISATQAEIDSTFQKVLSIY